METWFDRSAPGRALNWIACLPVRLLAPFARGKGIRVGSVSAYAWLLAVGCALMLCVPHGSWNNLYGVIFAAMLLLLYWWNCAAEERSVFRPGELGGGLWLFLAMCLVCSLRAAERAGSLRVAVFYWTGAALCYVAAAAAREGGQKLLVPCVYAAVLFTSAYGLWVYCLGGDAYGVPMGERIVPRLGSTLEHAINYSEFLSMALPLCLVWALDRPERRKRLWLSLPLVLPCAAMALTYARTGWIALGLALLVLIVCFDPRLLIPAGALGLLGLLLLPGDLKARLLSMFSWTNANASGRFVLWRECFAMLRRYWLTGIGLGPENFYRAWLPFSTGLLPFLPPHANMGYLEIFLSLGVVGFIGFACFFFRVFPRLRRGIAARKGTARRELIALAAALAGAALANVPEHLWFYPRVLFFWCVLWGTALGSTTYDTLARSGGDT